MNICFLYYCSLDLSELLFYSALVDKPLKININLWEYGSKNIYLIMPECGTFSNPFIDTCGGLFFCTLKYPFFYDLELDPCINTIYSLNMFTCKNQTVIINLSVPSLNMIKTSAFHFFNVGVYNHKWDEGSILECCPHFVESMLTWKRGCTRLCKGFDWFLWYTEINCPRNLWWFKMSDGNILVFFCRHVNCLYVFYELGIWK